MLTIENQILPVSTDDLKNYLRIDFDDDDARIDFCIRAATNWIEHETNLDLVERQWKEVIPFFSKVRLRKAPLKSIDSIKYFDENNDEQELTEGFTLHDGIVANGVLLFENTPPTFYRSDAVTILYTTGKNNDISKQAILWASAHFYINRETEVIGTITTPLKLGIDRLITQLKTGGYF